MKLKASRLAIIGLGIVLVGFGILYAAYPSKASVQLPEPRIIDKTPEKIAALKEDLVDRLEACESAGHTEDDAIIIYDNNSRGTLTGKTVYSLGTLQWKVSSIQHYAKIRDGKSLTQKEAVLLAFDREEARSLASYTIFETKDGISNWYNCSQQLGLSAEVNIIKKLSN